MEADKVIGPIIAWRLWVHDETTGLLKSVYKWQHLWQPLKEFSASCPLRKGLFKRERHSADLVPAEECSCGIFSCAGPQLLYREYLEWQSHLAWKHKNRCRHQLLERYQTSSPKIILGQVQIWGDIIESGQIFGKVLGYRSRRAYPNKLWVSHEEFGDAAEIVAVNLREKYQVETNIIESTSSLFFYDEGNAIHLLDNAT